VSTANGIAPWPAILPARPPPGPTALAFADLQAWENRVQPLLSFKIGVHEQPTAEGIGSFLKSV
jgi:hypothetical protein